MAFAMSETRVSRRRRTFFTLLATVMLWWMAWWSFSIGWEHGAWSPYLLPTHAFPTYALPLGVDFVFTDSFPDFPDSHWWRMATAVEGHWYYAGPCLAIGPLLCLFLATSNSLPRWPTKWGTLAVFVCVAAIGQAFRMGEVGGCAAAECWQQILIPTAILPALTAPASLAAAPWDATFLPVIVATAVILFALKGNRDPIGWSERGQLRATGRRRGTA